MLKKLRDGANVIISREDVLLFQLKRQNIFKKTKMFQQK